ncbi:MAG TPA: hypothetical protein VFF67_00380 [Thermoplasmata archaeon]|nr:hypothetical protein [Thermoplasmata archaeon]
MPTSDDGNRGDGWLSASDLADYAYCPRSFWYRHHPPAQGASPEARRARILGEEYHQSSLTAADRRWRARRAAWVALGAAAVLIAVGLAGIVLG